MLIAGLVAAIIGALFTYLGMILPRAANQHGRTRFVYSFYVVMRNKILYGILVVIVAKLISRHGQTITMDGLTPKSTN